MTEELEKIGVDVWIAGTIYVDAATDEEARKIVSERYAGTREKADTYNHMDGEDLPLDGDDFMSSAITLYGLCRDSELFPAVDPVRDAAPAMLEALQQVLDDWPNWEDGEPVNGGDMVEWFGTWRETVKAAVAKAEGRANG